MNLWTQILVVWVPFLGCVWADLGREKNILQYMFDKRIYDKRIRPKARHENNPVVVEVDTYIHSISELDNENMMYGVQLSLQQNWYDRRHSFRPSHNYITLTNLDNMWTHGVSFTNEITGQLHNLLAPNNFVRLHCGGDVLYSTRVSLKLFCPMDFRNFPMDKQTCSIKMVSSGYMSDDIILRWKSRKPVQVSKELLLPTLTLSNVSTDYHYRTTGTGRYSYIIVNFEFVRNFTLYLIHVFIPTILLVMASWLTFWLNPRSAIPRLCIWIGVLFCMITVTTFMTKTGPHVSYIKAIDIWIWTCIFFIFCVLIETGLVYNAVTKENRESEEKALVKTDKNMKMEDSVKNKPTNYSATPLKWPYKYSTQANKIDVVSRILFPTMFGIFNLVYWLTYTPINI